MMQGRGGSLRNSNTYLAGLLGPSRNTIAKVTRGNRYLFPAITRDTTRDVKRE